MKVNVWGINYTPELIGIAVYNTEMCEFFRSRGHEVTMVTAFPYYPAWKIEAPYRGKLFTTQDLGGVNVLRCWLYVPHSPTVLKRMLHELSFVMVSAWRQFWLPAPDVYLVVSPPLLLGLAAWFVSWLKRRPFVFHVQDLQPDTALELSMLKAKFLVDLLLAIEAFIYKRAARVSVPTRPLCQVLIEKKKLPPAKVVYFPNWVSLPPKLPESGGWKGSHGIDREQALVTYCGNVGVKQGLEIVLDAARALQGKLAVTFLIGGNGARKSSLRQTVDEESLGNVILKDVLPEEEHNQLLLDSSICLVTQRPGSGRSFFPSKLLKILAYERPVITNAEPGSPLFEAVKEGKFGLCVNSDGTSLAQAVSALLADEPTRQEMGKAGRKYVSQFTRELVLAAEEETLAAVAAERDR